MQKTETCFFFWYAVDTNLFRLGSTNPKKNFQTPGFSLVGGEAPHQKKDNIFFCGGA